MNETEKEAWQAFRGVVDGFLGNKRDRNYKELKPLDVEFMKALHSKVNIVPVISKADTLTISEVKRLKKRILEEIAGNEIQIYHLPDADDDEDEDFKEQTRSLKVSNVNCCVLCA
ncbi:unnamed protein product [Clavelina lepadiformis]|uniref:Septin-type G domain-containing protein n=1 Tax=Clavelina lepadiformis TaxID=159417 RepID=A0ABP0G767_CLALP